MSEEGTELVLPGDGFYDGILYFAGPLDALGVEGNAPADSAQDMTLAVVPEPAGAGGALAALLALRVRPSSRTTAHDARPAGSPISGSSAA